VSARLAVLVVRFGALGDVVLTTPLLRAIRRTHSDAAITVVTRERWAPVFAHNPHVAAIETPDRLGLRALARRLRGQAWDHRLDLHGSLRARAIRLLVGGRWRGWRKPRIRRALLVWTGVDRLTPAVPVAERYFAAARDLRVHPDDRPAEFFTSPEDERRAAAAAPPTPFVALAPGAAHATKRWPPDHWRALTGLLRGMGLGAVAVGTAAERDLLRAPHLVNACGIGLGATAALLRRALAVVAHDSGLMHVGTAVGTPVVALFGPTVPAFGYGPYHGLSDIIERPLRCRPCSVYGSTHCPRGHHRCMIEIAPQEVATAVERWLA
jgi:heptosyltransferase-2